ncbi:MAG TPA: hypothetical protein VML19_31050 [Verrucomicrobiae bacterium]|nr:hypothetical protein [Verrucomicrobiae bacterium]
MILPEKYCDPRGAREVAGIETVDGRTCVHLIARSATAVRHEYFDAQTGLLDKVRIDRRTPLGIDPSEVRFDGYSSVNGVRLPNSITIVSTGDRVLFQFTKVEANVDIAAGKFEIPPVKK